MSLSKNMFNLPNENISLKPTSNKIIYGALYIAPGAIAGSTIAPVGTVIGAVAFGILGYVGWDNPPRTTARKTTLREESNDLFIPMNSNRNSQEWLDLDDFVKSRAQETVKVPAKPYRDCDLV